MDEVEDGCWGANLTLLSSFLRIRFRAICRVLRIHKLARVSLAD